MAKQLQSARDKAYDRQRGHCYYCKRKVARGEATLEHRVPQSKGGTLRDGNGVMACRECNESKGSMPEDVFRQGIAAQEKWSEARAEMWRRANALRVIPRDSRSTGGDNA